MKLFCGSCGRNRETKVSVLFNCSTPSDKKMLTSSEQPIDDSDVVVPISSKVLEWTLKNNSEFVEKLKKNDSKIYSRCPICSCITSFEFTKNHKLKVTDCFELKTGKP